jgi:hypothetical protein
MSVNELFLNTVGLTYFQTKDGHIFSTLDGRFISMETNPTPSDITPAMAVPGLSSSDVDVSFPGTSFKGTLKLGLKSSFITKLAAYKLARLIL